MPAIIVIVCCAVIPVVVAGSVWLMRLVDNREEDRQRGQAPPQFKRVWRWALSARDSGVRTSKNPDRHEAD